MLIQISWQFFSPYLVKKKKKKEIRKGLTSLAILNKEGLKVNPLIKDYIDYYVLTHGKKGRLTMVSL